MKSNHSDKFYNVGTGIKTSILELTQKILDLSGKTKKLNLKNLDPPLLLIGLDVQKSYKDLKFKAQISLNEGLKEILTQTFEK